MGIARPIFVALATAAPALAQTDDCAGATDLGTGPVSIAFDTSLAVDTGAPATTSAEQQCGSLSDDVWFRWTSDFTGTAEFSTCDASTLDTEIAVWEGGDCAASTPLGCNDDSPDCSENTSFLAVSVTAGTTYLVQLGHWNNVDGDAFGAGLLSVSEAFAGGPCAGGLDIFEPNTGCADAVPLGDGVYTGLNVEESDNDYYAVTVADGATLAADLTFVDADGDVDLYIWDPLVACDTNVAGAGTASGALAVGFSASDDESVDYTNNTGAAQDLIIEVDMFTTGGCNEYTLTISGADSGPDPIGTPFCDTGNPNSTGSPGLMAAAGSTSVAANDVLLSVSSVPPGQFGIFLTSLTQTPPTPVADGFLCLGLLIGRYQHEGDVWQAAADGTASLQIDLASIPSPTGPVAAMAGESRSFQAWHRDANPAGPSANFTTGVEITFVP
ncbi:MAG: hypothetical protein AAFR54_05295 [Planctomycetota bacterium]